MTPSQCRAALKLLGWSRERLEGESGISVDTIMRFELQKRTAMPPTVDALRRALVAAGVEFGSALGSEPMAWLRGKEGW